MSRVVVLGGTHFAGLDSLRGQLLQHQGALASAGIVVPSTVTRAAATWHNFAWDLAGDDRFDPGLGSWASTLGEFRAGDADLLVVASEKLEHPLRNADRVTALRASVERAGAVLECVHVVRDPADYRNVTFARRSPWAGGRQFEQFLQAPHPAAQFDLRQVLGGLVRAGVARRVLRRADFVAGGLGGLLRTLGRADVAQMVPANGLDTTTVPDAVQVGLRLLAWRVVSSWADGPGVAQQQRRAVATTVRTLTAVVAARGAFWGWTPDLWDHHRLQFEDQRRWLAATFGVTLPSRRWPATNVFTLGDATPAETVVVLQRLSDLVAGPPSA